MIDKNLNFDDIKNSSLDDFPSKGSWDIFDIEESNNNQLYLFKSIQIKKENNSTIFLFFGEIKDYEKYHIRLLYPIFEKILKERFNDQAECDFASKTLCDFYFEVNVDKTLESITIEKILGIYNNKIKLVYSEVFQEADEKILLSSKINLKFSFPKHIKGLCKQYLNYFEKFLFDHNIDCELSLYDKNDITYMSIDVDESKIDADELKKALVAYFSLPVISQENLVLNNQDIANQQLLANVEHLKSQLRLANLTINQFENNRQINTQRPIGYALIDSLDEDSKLNLFDGLIKIGKIVKLKFLGIDIEFDLPLLIDKVKTDRKNN